MYTCRRCAACDSFHGHTPPDSRRSAGAPAACCPVRSWPGINSRSRFKALICRLIFTACKRFRPTTNNVTTTMTAVAAIRTFCLLRSPLGYVHVFVGLDRRCSISGMRLGVLDDRPGDPAFRNGSTRVAGRGCTRRSHPGGVASRPIRKSASSPTITFSSCAFPNASSSGGCCRLGDRHTQSKYPEKGCVPDVSRNISSPLACSVSVSTPSG